MNVQPTLLVNQPGGGLLPLFGNSWIIPISRGCPCSNKDGCTTCSGPGANLCGDGKCWGQWSNSPYITTFATRARDSGCPPASGNCGVFPYSVIDVSTAQFSKCCCQDGGGVEHTLSYSEFSTYSRDVASLAACIQGDRGIAQAIAPILRRQDQDAHIQRGCDIARIVVEVVWVTLHDITEVPLQSAKSRNSQTHSATEGKGWNTAQWRLGGNCEALALLVIETAAEGFYRRPKKI